MESTCPRKGRVSLSFVSKCLHLGLTLHVVTRCLASDDASATKRLALGNLPSFINPIATQLTRSVIFFEATIGHGKLFIQRALAQAWHIFMTGDNGINDGCLIREYRKRFSGGRMVQEKAHQCTNDVVIGQFATF